MAFVDDLYACRSDFMTIMSGGIDAAASHNAIFDCSNSTKIYLESYRVDQASLPSLGCVMSPAPRALMSACAPPHILTPGGLIRLKDHIPRWSVLVCPQELKPPCLLKLIVSVEMGDRSIIPDAGGFEVALDEHGVAVDEGQVIFSRWHENADAMSFWIRSLVLPILFALSLCHVKNITSTVHTASRELNAKRQRNGKPPLFRFRTLTIDPTKTIGRKRTGPVGEGEKKAAHLCRGHIVEYGNGKGLLFGKYSGKFWCPNHVRGDISRGLVLKDYHV